MEVKIIMIIVIIIIYNNRNKNNNNNNSNDDKNKDNRTKRNGETQGFILNGDRLKNVVKSTVLKRQI